MGCRLCRKELLPGAAVGVADARAKAGHRIVPKSDVIYFGRAAARLLDGHSFENKGDDLMHYLYGRPVILCRLMLRSGSDCPCICLTQI